MNEQWEFRRWLQVERGEGVNEEGNEGTDVEWMAVLINPRGNKPQYVFLSCTWVHGRKQIWKKMTKKQHVFLTLDEYQPVV